MAKFREYEVEIDPDLSKEDFEWELQGEEAGASELVSIAIDQDDDGNDVNVATFRALDARPNRLTMTLGASLPSGKQQVWQGQALVEGTAQQVSIYRTP